jgi:hypothetical protein
MGCWLSGTVFSCWLCSVGTDSPLLDVYSAASSSHVMLCRSEKEVSAVGLSSR